MAKHKVETTEYIAQWDDGTYQTGTIQPPKPRSGVITLLLLVVIFLGGICSALGILNIRLLQKLSQMDQQTTPLSMTPQPQLPLHSYLEDLTDPEPVLPQNETLQMHIVQSPYYSANSAQSVLSPQQILERNRESIVQIHCLTHFGTENIGTGIVLSSDGYILVNHHVIDAAKRIFVTLPDGEILRAALVGRDTLSDLAVLYVQAEGLTAAVFSNNQSLQVTDPSFFLGEDDTLRQSTVFSASRTFSIKSMSLNLIQTCEGGNSGPVFDSFGHVMGFQTGTVSQYFGTTDTVGTGLVIPTQTIRQIVMELVRHGHVVGRPRLGIQVETISKAYQQFWKLPAGLLLTEVEQNSNAAVSGLVKGDILLALDGKPVVNQNDLYAALYGLNIGDTVIAVVCRDQHKFTVKLTIEENMKQ